MTPLARRFFMAAAAFAIFGMVWGVQMSASGDHTLSPAHGHLNLLGFAMAAVFGTAYALAGSDNRAARWHLWLHVGAVILLVPGIVLAISGQGEALAQIGSLLVILSMAVFAMNLWWME